MRYRTYRRLHNAIKRVTTLESQLADMNHKRVEAGKGLSQVDFYRVGVDPQGFNHVVLAVMQDGKEYVCL